VASGQLVFSGVSQAIVFVMYAACVMQDGVGTVFNSWYGQAYLAFHPFEIDKLELALDDRCLEICFII